MQTEYLQASTRSPCVAQTSHPQYPHSTTNYACEPFAPTFALTYSVPSSPASQLLHYAKQGQLGDGMPKCVPWPIEDLNSVQGTVLDSMLPASISMQPAFVKLLVKLQIG